MYETKNKAKTGLDDLLLITFLHQTPFQYRIFKVFLRNANTQLLAVRLNGMEIKA